MEARGNMPVYPNGGNNVARSTLNYGVLPSLLHSLFGWQQFKRTSLAADFHTYALEWDHEFMRFFIDTRLQAMYTLDNRKSNMFAKGNFPATANNGSAQPVVVENIWATGNNVPNMAPFDQGTSFAAPALRPC
jgi:hypothetical protein